MHLNQNWFGTNGRTSCPIKYQVNGVVALSQQLCLGIPSTHTCLTKLIALKNEHFLLPDVFLFFVRKCLYEIPACLFRVDDCNPSHNNMGFSFKAILTHITSDVTYKACIFSIFIFPPKYLMYLSPEFLWRAIILDYQFYIK